MNAAHPMGRRQFLQGSLLSLGAGSMAAKATLSSLEAVVQVPKQPSPLETLAAKETVRYLYLRTGQLLTIKTSDDLPEGEAVIIAAKGWPVIQSNAAVREAASALKPQEYLVRTVAGKGCKQVWIVGGDPVAALYGAYRFLEMYGIRFYLHQDVIPDGKVAFSLPEVDETGKPAFELRGLHPWGGHAEGIDLWNTDQYKAVITQMAKMRMNFMLIHSYPAFSPYLHYLAEMAEPAVWVGLPEDVDEQGHVRFSSTASYWNSARAIIWGYQPKKTGDYRFGGSRLFESDDWGAEVMNGHFPYPTTPEARNEVFNRTGDMFREAFGLARALGMKTALGTDGGLPTPFEIVSKRKAGEPLNLQQFGPPLMISEEVQRHLRELGKNATDPAVIEEIYEGIFTRLMRAHPLDYYVIFTQEAWYWGGYDQEMFNSLIEEWKLALRAWEKLRPPFGLGTGGWVLGPDFDHAAFDKALPKQVAVSEFSRAYNAPVDEAFGRMEGRPKWAIPWIDEDSPILTPELWVGRIRKDSADALAYGCNALLTLLYRTLTTEPSASALALAGWDQKGWNPEFGKAHPLPPPSTFFMEGPVSKEATVDGLGWNPSATPAVSIPDEQAIAGTQDDALYRTFWEGLTAYRLRLPKGTYRVTLKFIEPVYNARGERTFDILLQGKTVQESMDIFARAGRFKATDCTFEGIEVAGGWLCIDFTAKRREPLLCAIEATGDGFQRRVKCGGGDCGDYRGDKLPYPRTHTFLWGRLGQSFEPRGLPVEDFYADWALAVFGPEVGAQAAAVFSALDGNIPLPSTWTGFNGGGAGGLKPDDRPWEFVRQEFGYVDQFEKLRPMVRGAGSLERYNFWLNQFRYTRATAHAQCIWGKLENALKQTRLEENPEKRRELAADLVLPTYKQLVAQVGEAYRLLLATVTEISGIECVLNWEGHNNLLGIEKTGQEIADMLGQSLPADARVPREHQGEPRLIVPTLRTLLEQGEPLRLRVIVLDNVPARSAAIHWRPLGHGEFRKQDLTHLGRGVYGVSLESVQNDIEYYIAAETTGGKKLMWPATAPEVNQTVVAWAALRS